MNAVENDLDFDLSWGGKVYKTVKAKDIWNKIIILLQDVKFWGEILPENL
jgi:hypothetical protein